jgi:hypothetical protein
VQVSHLIFNKRKKHFKDFQIKVKIDKKQIYVRSNEDFNQIDHTFIIYLLPKVILSNCLPYPLKYKVYIVFIKRRL